VNGGDPVAMPAVVGEDARVVETEPPIDVDRWVELAQRVLTADGAIGELTLSFVDADEIAELNRTHMGVDGPTDVLSFPLDDEPTAEVPTLLGDVVVSPAAAARQFAEHAGTLDDELALLVVHGVLHVLGHDHADPDETAVMRERELAHLCAFHWHGDAPDGFRQTHD
jgi:probable rRNA maturation factor